MHAFSHSTRPCYHFSDVRTATPGWSCLLKITFSSSYSKAVSVFDSDMFILEATKRWTLFPNPNCLSASLGQGIVLRVIIEQCELISAFFALWCILRPLLMNSPE